MGAGKSNIEKFKDNILMVIGLLFILTVVVAPVLWWAYWSFINLTIPLISNTWNHEEIVIFWYNHQFITNNHIYSILTIKIINQEIKNEINS